ncbi:MAG: aromatic-ring-hydroxylating dioxygenase subunit beta [Candidatus Binataceae bacterium]
MDVRIRTEIEDLLHAYADCIDDDRLEEWPGFFTERCIYKVIPLENAALNMPIPLMYADSRAMLKDRVTAHRKANIFAPHVYRHLVSHPRITGEENGEFITRSNYAIFRTMLDAAEYGRSELFSVGVYHDRIVFDEDGAKFKERVVVVDTARIPTLLVTPL